MAITFDAATPTQSGTNNLVWSHTVGAGINNILLVGVSIRQNSGSNVVDRVRYNGVNLVRAGALTSQTFRSELWYLINPIVGTADVQAQIVAQGRGQPAVVAGSVSAHGVDLSIDYRLPTRTFTTSVPDDSSVISQSIPNTLATDFIVDHLCTLYGTDLVTLTPGAGQVQHWLADHTEVGIFDVSSGSSREPGNDGSVTNSWDITADPFQGRAILVATLLSAAVGAGEIIKTAVVNIEGLGIVTKPSVVNIESLKSGISSFAAINYEALQGVIKPTIINIEAQQGVVKPSVINIESLRDHIKPAVVNIESVRDLIKPAVINIESQQEVLQTSVINIEGLKVIIQTAIINIEADGVNTQVIQTAIINIESVRNLIVSGELNIEGLQGVIKPTILNIESLSTPVKSSVINIESLRDLIKLSVINIEAFQGVIKPSVLNIESLRGIIKPALVNIESVRQVIAIAVINIEADGIFTNFFKWADPAIFNLDRKDLVSGTEVILVVVLRTNDPQKPAFARVFNVTDSEVVPGSEATTNVVSDIDPNMVDWGIAESINWSSYVRGKVGNRLYRIEIGGPSNVSGQYEISAWAIEARRWV